MNPMAKDHVPALLDQLIAIDGDEIAGEVTNEIGDIGGDFRVTTILADDLLGGGTNRYAAEFSSAFLPLRRARSGSSGGRRIR